LASGELRNEDVLYIGLIERKLATLLLTVLESWLNMLLVGTAGSHYFSLAAGARQVLSPLLFAVFIVRLLKGLKHVTLVAILIAFAAVFFSTPMIYCYWLLQSLDYGHYYVLVKTT